MYRQIIGRLLIIHTVLVLCSCGLPSTLTTDAHLDGSADDKISSLLNRIWLVPNVTDEEPGAFLITGKSKTGPVAALCFIYKVIDDGTNTCSRVSIKAQTVSGDLYVSLDDYEHNYKIYQIQVNDKGERIYFNGIFPSLNEVKIREALDLLKLKDKPKYTFGYTFFLQRSDIVVTKELAKVVGGLDRVPGNKPELDKWLRKNFRMIYEAEPKLIREMKKVLEYDKALAKKLYKKPSKFVVTPEHDEDLAERIAVKLGKANAPRELRNLTVGDFLIRVLGIQDNGNDLIFFKAGEKIYFAQQNNEEFILKQFRPRRDGNFETLPLTPALRAEDYDTAALNPGEIIEFLKENQGNRFFFYEKDALVVKGYTK